MKKKCKIFENVLIQEIKKATCMAWLRLIFQLKCSVSLNFAKVDNYFESSFIEYRYIKFRRSKH
ncbi:hypothetical protein HZS_2071 [Henneguya salminicola]|nr:hypothetical protein HZS_2071 [Henneguya salminicola]